MNFRSSAVFSCGRAVYTWEINHAVLLIGYDSSGNYIIKNSWGTTWGNAGYALLHSMYSCGVGLYVSQFSDLKLSASNITANQLTTGESKLNSFRVYWAVALTVLIMILY